MNSSGQVTVLGLHAAELREFAAAEVKEYQSFEKHCSLANHAQLFRCPVTQSLSFLEKARTFQFITILCAQGTASNALSFSGLETLFGPAVNEQEIKFSVKIFAMQGNEHRISLQQQVHPQLRKEFESLGYSATLDYKNPDFIFRIFFDGTQYYVGLQIHSDELDSRAYRVFSHKASFRGDFAQLLLSRAKCKEATNLTICPARDGVLAIEAALLRGSLTVYPLQKDKLLASVPLFSEHLKSPSKRLVASAKGNASPSILAIEAQGRNQRALRSNVKRAKVEKEIRVLHTNVENAASVITQQSQDLIIVQFTKKDEAKLNDYFYFFRSALKEGGRVFLITRSSYELELTSEFSLLSSQECQWKGSSYLLSEFSKC